MSKRCNTKYKKLGDVEMKAKDIKIIEDYKGNKFLQKKRIGEH